MSIELLPEPLYRRTVSGNRARVHKPNKSRIRALRFVIYERDGWACVACGKSFDRPADWDGSQCIWGLELGHIIPYIKGGPYTVDNLQAECRQCNRAKKIGT